MQDARLHRGDRTAGRSSAVIGGTRVGVRDVVGYLRIGETPESLVEHVLPHLTLAQVYDALSYYNDHQADIDQELSLNTEEHARRVLHDSLGEEGFRHVTGQFGYPATISHGNNHTKSACAD
ncbi:MAG: DUF433 domain-containing protein [Chloroflexi bacterium]|nr:DUF433 domain-containing protein [Chloroflexota bacterium]